LSTEIITDLQKRVKALEATVFPPPPKPPTYRNPTPQELAGHEGALATFQKHLSHAPDLNTKKSVEKRILQENSRYLRSLLIPDSGPEQERLTADEHEREHERV